LFKEALNTDVVLYIAIFLAAFSMVVFSIPSIIYTSLKYKLFDDNDLYRKNHKRNISRLGGIAIFCSFTISILLFSAFKDFKEANYLVCGCILLSALGLKDDLYGTNTRTKFILQISVAVILVFFGDFRLSSLYGVLNIGEMNFFWGGVFSIVLIIFLNNAFNLIDGIDGLAATVGILVNLSFGILFAIMHQLPNALIAFALVGAILGFVKYNWWPAKIFMGDTGALTIGLISASLAINFIEMNKFTGLNKPYFYSAPAIAVSILIVPIFDSLRIFCIRILNRRSPFKGDRNHMHHRLEKLGLKPNYLVLVTAGLNILIISLTLLLSRLGNYLLIILIIGLCAAFNLIITLLLRKKARFN